MDTRSVDRATSNPRQFPALLKQRGLDKILWSRRTGRHFEIGVLAAGFNLALCHRCMGKTTTCKSVAAVVARIGLADAVEHARLSGVTQSMGVRHLRTQVSPSRDTRPHPLRWRVSDDPPLAPARLLLSAPVFLGPSGRSLDRWRLQSGDRPRLGVVP